MILAHLSDLHLGHRGYESPTARRNVQELDVARAFQAAVAEVASVGPDLVLVAGDVFDSPEPPSRALVTVTRALENLRAALPGIPVLMVAGARDTPRLWGDPGALAALDTLPGVEATTGAPRSVRSGAGGATHVFMLPHRSVLDESRPAPRPDPDARWNVLLAHGDIAANGGTSSSPEAPHVLEIDPDDWDYVALGSRHLHEEIVPGSVVYPGSLERVGPEPWTEAHRPKGFVIADLSGGRTEFRRIPGRPVVALAPIRWDPSRPDRMNERIREVRDEVPGGMSGKVVRLRLENVVPEALGNLDPELLSSLRRDAAHLYVEVDQEPAPVDAGPEAVLERVVERLPERDRGPLGDAAAALLGEAREQRPSRPGGDP